MLAVYERPPLFQDTCILVRKGKEPFKHRVHAAPEESAVLNPDPISQNRWVPIKKNTKGIPHKPYSLPETEKRNCP